MRMGNGCSQEGRITLLGSGISGKSVTWLDKLFQILKTLGISLALYCDINFLSFQRDESV